MNLHLTLDRYSPEIHYINHPDTIEAINIFAKEHRVNIIITLHEQQTGLVHLFHKSASKKLALHSQIPLLVIPV